ncbi:urea ABC transporter ATP-binding subunit UrtE [Pseudomonas neustonica]|jgi:urea transport system ATP-binding protein|uniref:Urea ABC transporter ATP-binding subunit UrtE n=1 Tax=Pseudomonas neustonica TaxID=2487346 RepID=A0ABX9XGA9_9PSED|nr:MULTISPECIES: urea ABC transporter ATP-binding subunit UrtE [Pseudomonas]ROZ81628.1 urea ABC transporter ATP-binding subunit UrtE [Pseudomonas sp. SSM44]ROZ83378.1 urea ABC transporter ATP-binding subunit UrtE [Pseudomonas neustonica]|tara:strand:+ start:1455 stop:2144 length:690 start_codon:yes stop_codon:yes gene_type:complete
MLTVSDLRVSYGMSEVIHGINLEVGENETVAIMGRNGMGKTTLFKSLIGMIPCSGGEITFNGKGLSKLQSYQRVASGIAYVPQGRMVFPTLTVEENIMAGLEVTGRRKVPDDIYELFPVLLEMRHRKAGNLSGGQQQQLAIGRALAADPKVLLLDEPTEGIQPSIIKQLATTLNEIKQMRKISIVVSEQVLSFALNVADRMLVIDKGQIVHEAVGEQIDKAHISSYLSV